MKKFDEKARARFLEHFAKTARMYESARMAGVCPATVYEALQSDKEFVAQRDEAYETFRETIETEIKRRAVEGVPELVIQGGNVVSVLNEVTGKWEPVYKMVLSDKMLELYAKRHIPEYRDKGTLDVNVQGGVLVVPGGLTEDQWEKLIEQRREQEAAEVPSTAG